MAGLGRRLHCPPTPPSLAPPSLAPPCGLHHIHPPSARSSLGPMHPPGPGPGPGPPPGVPLQCTDHPTRTPSSGSHHLPTTPRRRTCRRCTKTTASLATRTAPRGTTNSSRSRNARRATRRSVPWQHEHARASAVCVCLVACVPGGWHRGSTSASAVCACVPGVPSAGGRGGGRDQRVRPGFPTVLQGSCCAFICDVRYVNVVHG